MLIPAGVAICAKQDHLTPLTNLGLQTALITISTALSLYTMVRTRYMPYVYVGFIFFLLPSLSAWGYSLFLWFKWVVLRPTSEPRLLRPLLSESPDVEVLASNREGPLDRLYQQQQSEPIYGTRLLLDALPEPRQLVQASSAAAQASGSAAQASSSAQGIDVGLHVDVDVPRSVRNYGTLKRPPSVLHFDNQMEMWQPYIIRYLAFLVMCLLAALAAFINAVFGLALWNSLLNDERRPKFYSRYVKLIPAFQDLKETDRFPVSTTST